MFNLKLADGSYQITITVGTKLVKTIINTEERDILDVNAYTSGKWQDPSNALIRDFKMESFDKGTASKTQIITKII